jgi:hypothetical protein
MKDQILRIAKVKSEKEFYKKYPTEEAFMKAHGKAFKKAAMGAKMVNDQLHQLTDFGNPPIAQVGAYVGGQPDKSFSPIQFNDILANVNAINSGISREDRARQEAVAKVNPQAAPQRGGDPGILKELPGIIDELALKKKNGGRKLKKGQSGLDAFGIGQMLGKAFEPKGGVGTGLVDAFSKKGTGQGMLDASANLFKDPTTGKGIGFKAGLKTLGDSGNLGTIGKAAGVGLLNAAPQILQGVGQLNEQRANITKANQFAQISGLTAQAAESQPEVQKRRYIRPEDSLVQPGQAGDPQGTGTNYLSAEDGAMISGNPTEIQNTYAPEDIYVGLGYEPLNESNLKQYAHGGNIPTAEFGEYFQSSGQASIGKGIGSAVGSLFGPLGSKVGGFLGSVAGNLLGGVDDARQLKHYQEEGMKNTERAAWAQGARALRSQNSAFMKDGGYVDDEHAWVSNSWQPQVITKFGEHSMKDLLKPPHDADMLRAGGTVGDDYYTPPSARALSTERPSFAMGGDLQTTWGGKAEPMSYNPYLPGTGETVMFRGQSHDETDGNGRSGIGVKYGSGGMAEHAQNGANEPAADVEVERGEPAMELIDPSTGEKVLNVAGNMIIPSYGVNEIGDKKAKGKKFKHYVADLSKQEVKQNKTIEKATELVNNANPNDPFDQLSLNAGKAMIMGANLKLKDIADKKQKAAMVQNAILDTAEEFGVESDGLAKGKLRAIKDPAIGRDGKKLKKAQSGKGIPLLSAVNTPGYTVPELGAKIKIPYDFPSLPNYPAPITGGVPPFSDAVNAPADPFTGLRLPNFSALKQRTNIPYSPNYIDIAKAERPRIPAIPAKIDIAEANKNIANLEALTPTKSEGSTDWGNLADTALSMYPFFRPTNQMPLDPDQLMGEMYALGNNQLQPVQAQTYQPLLDQPYDISLQDQLNAIDAQGRAAILASGEDPSAQSVILAQVADLKNKVLGEQFRMNQMNRAAVYQANRQALNQAQLQNLGILDTQYVRQETAQSKTKAEAAAALNSIADKIAKNKLENRTLGVMENMYNYRYDPQGRAYSINNPYQWYTPTVSPTDPDLTDNLLKDGTVPVYDNKGNIISYKVIQPTKTPKSTKKRNGDIVKAIKNL